MTVKDLGQYSHVYILIYKDYSIKQHYGISKDILKTVLKNTFPMDIKKILVKTKGTLDFEELKDWETLLEEEEEENQYSYMFESLKELRSKIDNIYRKENDFKNYVKSQVDKIRNYVYGFHDSITSLENKIKENTDKSNKARYDLQVIKAKIDSLEQDYNISITFLKDQINNLYKTTKEKP